MTAAAGIAATADEWQAALTSIRGMLGRHFRPNHGYVAGRHDIASARSGSRHHRNRPRGLL